MKATLLSIICRLDDPFVNVRKKIKNWRPTTAVGRHSSLSHAPKVALASVAAAATPPGMHEQL